MMQSIAIVSDMCTADYDLLRDEIHRSAEAARDRMDDRTKVICRSRNRLMGARLDELKESVFGRRSPVKRALRAVENVWAMIWAICHCWRDMGENAGLWVDERKEK